MEAGLTFITFRDLLRNHRRRHGWTQEEMSRQWNYSPGTISAWERGRRTPSMQEVPKLAGLLNIAPDVLAGIIGQAKRERHDSDDAGEEGEDAETGAVLDDMLDWYEGARAYETLDEIERIYRNRTEFSASFSYTNMLEQARHVVAIGISLNPIALTYSQEQLRAALVDCGARYELCFLDPDGPHCAEREEEEGLAPGTIASLTRLNIQFMQALHARIRREAPDCAANLVLWRYELAPRYNIYLIDDTLMTVQCYGYGRGVDTPTMVLRRQQQQDGGLFAFYANIARYVLAHAQPLET